MKKFYSFLFAAVALVGFAACNSDSTEEPAPAKENVGKMEFMANIGEDTKTQLNGKSVMWCEDDIIGVVVPGHNDNKPYQFTIAKLLNGGKSAVFTGEAPLSASHYYAIYPYYADASFSDGSWNFTVPANQAAVDGSFADGAAASTASAAKGENTLNFSNICAVLKFQVPAACNKVSFASENANVTVEGKMTTEGVYYAVVPATNHKFTVRIDGYLSKASENTLSAKANTIYDLKTLPKLERFSWGLVGEHQGWDISNPSSMYKVDENVYAALNQTLKANGFKFAKVDGAASWNDNTTNFGAWKKSSGKEYFNFMTEMPAGSWYGNPLYSNNAPNDQQNIGVTDFNKSYDIYLAVTASGNWGIGVKYTIVEAGTAVTYPF